MPAVRDRKDLPDGAGLRDTRGMNQLRLYIAGPMTGYDEYNYPAFDAAEEDLRAAGYLPFNPAKSGGSSDLTWPDNMRLALRMMLGCEAVALLPEWERSRGASIEMRLAVDLGFDVLPLEHWLTRGVSS